MTDGTSLRMTSQRPYLLRGLYGVSHPVRVPMSAVLGIYARETGHGMMLPDDIPGTGADPQVEGEDILEDIEGEDGDGGDDPSPSPKRGSHLRVIK